MDKAGGKLSLRGKSDGGRGRQGGREIVLVKISDRA